MGWDSPAFSRRYKRIPISSLFLQLGRWFTPLLSLLTAYVFSSGSSGISQRGFPHSDIPGSKLVCSSPGLIAAYRVLHRLLAPRHSPYALSSLTTSMSNPIPDEMTFVGNCIRSLIFHCVSTCVDSFVVLEKNYRLQDIQLSKNFELQTAKFKLHVVVENTGLEPVTSWLQTRRSPS